MKGGKGSTEHDVVEAITMTNMCQEFHSLPSAGGILDQDHVWVRLMQTVLSAQSEYREKQRKKK